MEPKITSIGVGIISVAALVVAIAKPGPETKTLVAASQSEDDVAMTEIAKASPEAKPVTCTKKYISVLQSDFSAKQELLWFCSDVGYDPNRQAYLNKKAGADGVKIEIVPAQDGTILKMPMTITRGEVGPKPDDIAAAKPVIEEEKVGP